MIRLLCDTLVRSMKLMLRVLLSLLSLLFLSQGIFSVSPAYATVNEQITYQARLYTSTGAPVPDGTYSIKFSLYTASTGGTPTWTASGNVASPSGVSVTVTNGGFTVQLGASDQNSLSEVDWSQNALYLGITVGSDSEMSPRRRLTSAPQALYSADAGLFQGMSASSTVFGSDSLFTLNQTSNTAATGTRTTLEVRSRGTNDSLDYLFRGINSADATVFSINRQGAVTTTGALFVNQISATSTFLGALTVGTSTFDMRPDARFSLGTNGLLVGGAIGTASSVYANAVYSTTASSTDLMVSRNATTTALRSLKGLNARLDISSITETNSLTVAVGPSVMRTEGDRIAIGGNDSTFRLFQVNSPGIATARGTFTMPSATQLRDIVLAGNMAYSAGTEAGGERLYAADITDLNNPVWLSSLTIGSGLGKMAISGSLVYVSDNGLPTGVRVIDVSNPRSMRSLGIIDLSGYVIRQVRAEGSLLYVLLQLSADATGSMRVYDMSNPMVPRLRSTVSLYSYPWDIDVINRHAWVTFYDGTPELVGVDFTDLASPVTQTLVLPTQGGRVLALGDTIVVADYTGAGIYLVDAESSTTTTYIGEINSSAGNTFNSLGVVGRHLFGGDYSALKLISFDLKGMKTDVLSAGSARVGTLQISGSSAIDNNLSVRGSVMIGSGVSVAGNSSFYGSSTSPLVQITNQHPVTSGTAWGLFTSSLLVGDSQTATGTNDYVSVMSYNSGQSRFGLCLDNTNTAGTCQTFAGTSTVYSLLADDAIGANAFDLAERYTISGSVEPGDLLIFDPDRPLTMKKSPGTPYDRQLAGVVSTRPGFILGVGGGEPVALAGRVPTKVTIANGAIAIGDLLTSSEQPGVAMKATQPGQIIGRALEAATSDGVIEVFIQPGYDASALLQSDGSLATLSQSVAVLPEGEASSAAPNRSSMRLLFRGESWNGYERVTDEFRLYSQSTPTSSAFVIENTTSTTLFSLSSAGQLSLTGDLLLGGKLYPSRRGQSQNETYLFIDRVSGEGDYLSTNGSGFQSQSGYDYAERYASPDTLEAGDLVAVHEEGRVRVQRTLSSQQFAIGIVSVKPGFVAGRADAGTYPIALAGRVPTKVSTMKGAIKPGDALAPSSIPGVAVKAVEAGPTVGVALEAYSGSDVGQIEVFVNPGWWGGRVATEKKARGFAEIEANQSRVRIKYDSLGAYPHVTVTPYGQVEGGWWVDQVTDRWFDIVIGRVASQTVRFSWRAEGMDEDERLTREQWPDLRIDPYTGELIPGQISSDRPEDRLPPPVSEESGSVAAPEEDTAPPVAAPEGSPESEGTEPSLPQEPVEPSSAPASEGQAATGSDGQETQVTNAAPETPVPAPEASTSQEIEPSNSVADASTGSTTPSSTE